MLLNKAFNRLVGFFKPELHIYTDGSHKGKWGSWAFVVTANSQIIHEASGREAKTNCNRMEFRAAIEALTYLKEGARARVSSDSRVLIRAMTSNEDRPAASLDQLLILDHLKLSRRIRWSWVKAHAGHRFNERCDELCRQARLD